MATEDDTERSEQTEETPLATPSCSAVDLCLRMMLRAFYDEERNRRGSEVKELLLDWFSQDEIDAASELIRQHFIPPPIDLSSYKQND